MILKRSRSSPLKVFKTKILFCFVKKKKKKSWKTKSIQFAGASLHFVGRLRDFYFEKTVRT